MIAEIKQRLKKYILRRSRSPSISSDEWERFYNAFENRFRGSKDLISERLIKRYGDLLKEKIKASGNAAPLLVDVGCGRGEMLDLAQSLGFRTLGAEVSKSLARINRKLGHEVRVVDALGLVSCLGVSSVDVITSMHVFEHCESEYNLNFIKAAHRCLRPDGLILIETPSLFSLWAGHRQFYLDPTHIKPIHPELVKFACEHFGFRRAEIIGFEPVPSALRSNLAEVPKITGAEEFKKLEAWLYGPMDMSIQATK